MLDCQYRQTTYTQDNPMPRPSVKKERTEEILRAFERCAARYGVEGSTLERLADESGLRRSLIRHYVGNRDDLIKALLKRFLDESNRQTELLLSHLPEKNTAKTMIEYLFDNSYSDRHYTLVANALFNAATNAAYLANPLKTSVDSFINSIANVLSNTNPNSSSEDRYAVASGIVGMYFHIESVDHLGDTQKWRTASKRSALMLLKVLN